MASADATEPPSKRAKAPAVSVADGGAALISAVAEHIGGVLDPHEEEWLAEFWRRAESEIIGSDCARFGSGASPIVRNDSGRDVATTAAAATADNEGVIDKIIVAKNLAAALIESCPAAVQLGARPSASSSSGSSSDVAGNVSCGCSIMPLGRLHLPTTSYVRSKGGGVSVDRRDKSGDNTPTLSSSVSSNELTECAITLQHSIGSGGWAAVSEIALRVVPSRSRDDDMAGKPLVVWGPSEVSLYGSDDGLTWLELFKISRCGGSWDCGTHEPKLFEISEPRAFRHHRVCLGGHYDATGGPEAALPFDVTSFTLKAHHAKAPIVPTRLRMATISQLLSGPKSVSVSNAACWGIEAFTGGAASKTAMVTPALSELSTSTAPLHHSNTGKAPTAAKTTIAHNTEGIVGARRVTQEENGLPSHPVLLLARITPRPATVSAELSKGALYLEDSTGVLACEGVAGIVSREISYGKGATKGDSKWRSSFCLLTSFNYVYCRQPFPHPLVKQASSTGDTGAGLNNTSQSTARYPSCVPHSGGYAYVELTGTPAHIKTPGQEQHHIAAKKVSGSGCGSSYIGDDAGDGDIFSVLRLLHEGLLVRLPKMQARKFGYSLFGRVVALCAPLSVRNTDFAMLELEDTTSVTTDEGSDSSLRIHILLIADQLHWTKAICPGDCILIHGLRVTRLFKGRPGEKAVLRAQKAARFQTLSSDEVTLLSARHVAGYSTLDCIGTATAADVTAVVSSCQHLTKTLAAYEGTITSTRDAADGLYQLDDRLLLVCAHMAVPGYGRGLRCGARVVVCNVHPITDNGILLGLGCCARSSVHILAFSSLDTPYTPIVGYNSYLIQLAQSAGLQEFTALRQASKTVSTILLAAKAPRRGVDGACENGSADGIDVGKGTGICVDFIVQVCMRVLELAGHKGLGRNIYKEFWSHALGCCLALPRSLTAFNRIGGLDQLIKRATKLVQQGRDGPATSSTALHFGGGGAFSASVDSQNLGRAVATFRVVATDRGLWASDGEVAVGLLLADSLPMPKLVGAILAAKLFRLVVVGHATDALARDAMRPSPTERGQCSWYLLVEPEDLVELAPGSFGEQTEVASNASSGSDSTTTTAATGHATIDGTKVEKKVANFLVTSASRIKFRADGTRCGEREAVYCGFLMGHNGRKIGPKAELYLPGESWLATHLVIGMVHRLTSVSFARRTEPPAVGVVTIALSSQSTIIGAPQVPMVSGAPKYQPGSVRSLVSRPQEYWSLPTAADDDRRRVTVRGCIQLREYRTSEPDAYTGVSMPRDLMLRLVDTTGIDTLDVYMSIDAERNLGNKGVVDAFGLLPGTIVTFCGALACGGGGGGTRFQQPLHCVIDEKTLVCRERGPLDPVSGGYMTTPNSLVGWSMLCSIAALPPGGQQVHRVTCVVVGVVVAHALVVCRSCGQAVSKGKCPVHCAVSAQQLEIRIEVTVEDGTYVAKALAEGEAACDLAGVTSNERALLENEVRERGPVHSAMDGILRVLLTRPSVQREVVILCRHRCLIPTNSGNTRTVRVGRGEILTKNPPNQLELRVLTVEQTTAIQRAGAMLASFADRAVETLND